MLFGRRASNRSTVGAHSLPQTPQLRRKKREKTEEKGAREGKGGEAAHPQKFSNVS